MGTIFLFGISMGEIVIVFLVILLLFGANKIPEFARMFGKGMNEFRKAADDIKREFNDSTSDLKEDLNEAKDYITRQGQDMKDGFRGRRGRDGGAGYRHGSPPVSQPQVLRGRVFR